MANVNVSLLLFSLYMFATFTHTLKTSFEYDGTRFQETFREIFSLSLHIDNVSVALMNNGVTEAVPNTVANVSDLTGVWTEDKIDLQGLIDIACKMVDSIVCELFGYESETGNYKHLPFAPNLDFHVGISNSSLNQQTPQKIPGDVLLACTATVGSNRTRVSWQSHVSGERNSVVSEQLYTVKRTALPHCHVMFASRLTYVHKAGQGRIYFRCMYGETEVGSISVGDETEGASDDLPFHLFLSSILLVYTHFVILPLVCAFLMWKGWIGDCRNPRDERMRKLRGWISFCVALAFSIWWISVIITFHTHSECASYLSFFLIEVFFLLVYAIIRLLSQRLEKTGDRHLYNGRVALSCGAVITPSICWIMIKSQQSIPVDGLECFWWIVTVISLFAFVFVSHARELKAWEKDQ